MSFLPALSGGSGGAPAIPPARIVAAGTSAITSADQGGVVFVTGAGAVVINLVAGTTVSVSCQVASPNVTVNAPSGGTINGAASVVLTSAYASVTFLPVPSTSNFGIN